MPDTAIEWTDAVWNPVVGCSRVSEGCRHCYAERFAHRGMTEQHRGLTVLSSQGPQWTGEVRFLEDRLGEPLRWKKPRRVFVNSMSDLFHPRVTDEQIAAVFGVMAAATAHTFQVLTKRPERLRSWFQWAEAGALDKCASYADDALLAHLPRAQRALCFAKGRGAQEWPLPNVWLGVSVEDQVTADDRIPHLLLTPAALHFVSAEPLLTPIDFDRPHCQHCYFRGTEEIVNVPGGNPWCTNCDSEACYGMWLDPLNDGVAWVIVGGETGPGSRPCDLAWVRHIVKQCRDEHTACFVKQLGQRPVGWASKGLPPVLGGQLESWPDDLQVRQFPEVRDGD